MFYTLIFCFLFLLSLFESASLRGIALNLRVCIYFLFWFIAGFSYQTGVDWFVYEEIYANAVTIPEAISLGDFFGYSGIVAEFGFSLLASLMKTLIDDYYIFQTVLMLISTFFFFKNLRLYSVFIPVVVLLYFGCIYLTLNMSGVRQAVALSILFYGLKFVHDKKFFKYVIVVLGASCFHLTAILFLPLYLFLNIRISSKVLFVMIFFGLLLYLLRISLSSEFLHLLAQLSDNIIFKKLNFYIEMRDSFTQARISPKMLIYVSLLLWAIIIRKKIEKQNTYSNIFINLFFLYVFSNEVLWDTTEVVFRFSLYFMMGFVVLLPIMMMSFVEKNNRIAFLILIALVSFTTRSPILLNLNSGVSYNPYQNYLIYSLFDIPSTGYERRVQFINEDN